MNGIWEKVITNLYKIWKKVIGKNGYDGISNEKMRNIIKDYDILIMKVVDYGMLGLDMIQLIRDVMENWIMMEMVWVMLIWLKL